MDYRRSLETPGSGLDTRSGDPASAAALDHGDLAGTTDFRSVVGELLVRRAGLPESALAQVFPGFRPTFLGLARAG